MSKAMLAAVLVLSACATAPNREGPAFPFGSYRIRAAQVDYDQGGRYRIYDATQTYVEGRYDIQGDTIAMTDVGGQYACQGDTNPGRYKWSAENGAIRFSLLEDRCDARRVAMQESPFPPLAGK
jgi:hypothetical protein